MPSEDAAGERLPPISLLFGIGTAARSLLVPAVAVLLFSPARSEEAWIAVLFFPAVVASVLKYVSFRYHLGDDEMIIREGILHRNERHIPYARIQNIDLIQNVLHRLFKVAVVRLETASGGKPEAVISVLTLPRVEDMRARVFRERAAGAAADEAAATAGAAADGAGRASLLELSLKELAIFGVISNRGLVVVAAALGLLSQSGFFQDPEWAAAALGNPETAPHLPQIGSGFLLVALLLAALVAFLILLRLFSVLWAILKLYGFRLDLHGEDLRAKYGFLTKVTSTIPRHRVQLVTVNLTPLHRWFRRASVQVDTAGGGGGGDGNQRGVQERQWLAPVIPRRQVLTLLRQAMPGARIDRLDWHPISRRAWQRLFNRWLVLLLVLMVPGLLLVGFWSLGIVLAGLPLAYAHSQLYVRRSGYALTPGAVLYRSGCWVRRLSIVPFAKMQVLALHQTPFDRRRGMASVHVDTAGATLRGHRVAIQYLDVETAGAVLHRLDLEAARTAFEW